MRIYLAFLILQCGLSIAAEPTPTEVVQKYLSTLSSAYQSSPQNVAQEVHQYFDFEGLAHDCVNKHWKKLSTKQKKEYTEVFTQLVEKQHLRKAQSLRNISDIKCGKEKIEQTKATVSCVIPGPNLDIDADYELRLKDSHWMIRNFVMDRLNVRTNYQTMFNRDLQYFSFDEMLQKMKLHLTETEK